MVLSRVPIYSSYDDPYIPTTPKKPSFYGPRRVKPAKVHRGLKQPLTPKPYVYWHTVGNGTCARFTVAPPTALFSPLGRYGHAI